MRGCSSAHRLGHDRRRLPLGRRARRAGSLPEDIRDVWIASLKTVASLEMTKGDYERIIPVHSHLIEQGFLDYVEKRRKSRLLLFYDLKRARGGENANPRWQKIAQRLG